MSKRSIRPWPGICIALALLATGLVTAQPVNVFKNAGFEDPPEKNNQPSGWTLGPKGGVTQENPHSGKACAWVAQTDPKGGSNVSQTDIAVEPGKTYQATMWFRSHNKPANPDNYQLQLSSSGGKGENRYWTAASYRGSEAWAKARLIFAPTVSPISISATFRGAGKSHLDDFSLAPVIEKDYQDNLILDGDFEEGTPGQPSYAWLRYGHGLGDPYVDTSCAHDGKHSLCIEGNPTRKTNPADPWYGTASTYAAPVRAGRSYALILWAKAENKYHRVRPTVSASTPGPHWYTGKWFQVGPEWEDFMFIFKVPDRHSTKYGEYWRERFQLSVAIFSASPGKVWIDDVLLVEEPDLDE